MRSLDHATRPSKERGATILTRPICHYCIHNVVVSVIFFLLLHWSIGGDGECRVDLGNR